MQVVGKKKIKVNNNKKGLITIPFAYQDLGYVCLKELLKTKVRIPFVVTHRDAKGEEIWFRSVYKLAKNNDIPVYFAEDLSEDKLSAYIKRENPDLIISVYYRKLLPKHIFAIPKMGSINLHGSFLPYYRGRCPVNWAILKGEKFTGLTFHFITEKPDAGDIIRQIKIPIARYDTVRSIYKKMSLCAPILLKKVLRDFMQGNVKSRPQEHKKATYFGLRRPSDGKIDWHDTAENIYNLVRAVTHPYPGAFSFLRGKKVYVWESRMIRDNPSLKKMNTSSSGQIVSISKKKGVVVKTGKGFLGCSRLQLKGEKECDGHIFARYYNLKIGDSFSKEVCNEGIDNRRSRFFGLASCRFSSRERP